MNRRHALKRLTAGVSAAATALWIDNLRAVARAQSGHIHVVTALDQGGAPWAPKALSPHEFETVGVLVELIIPATETPGARAVFVDRYVDSVLDAAQPADRDKFLAGLRWLDRRSRSLFGKEFAGATSAQQTDLLTRLSAEGNPQREAREGREFFEAIKSLTIAGYYTTEVGLRQELGDDGVLVLAEFKGCTHPEHQS